MKFIHAADLHLDSPMRGLDSYEGAPVEELRGSTRRALSAMVDLALREHVDLVVLAGDIFDRDLGDFHAVIYFREQLVRLTRVGIRVFLVKGNHDAEGQIGKRLPDVEGAHVFSSRTGEVVDLPELGVAVHGRSFPDRSVPEDLLPSYKDPLPGRFNIGILHTSLSGNVDHDPYAPTDVATLARKGYDYFALGHIHARQVVRDEFPRIVYPGNLQGRHVGETGSKGCELVTVEHGKIVAAEHVSLEVVRWHQLELSASGVDTLTELAQRFHQECFGLVRGLGDRLHTMRVKVQGETTLHRQEAAQPGTIAAALQAATQDFMEAQLWIESVQLDLRSPMDRATLLMRDDAFGEVIRLVDELAGDEAGLSAWVRSKVDNLPALPPELADLDPERLTSEQLRALMADAEATVLAKLSTTGV